MTWSRHLPGVPLEGKAPGKKAQQMQRQGDRLASWSGNHPTVWLEKWVKESIILIVSHGAAESRELAIFNVNTPHGISSGALGTQHLFNGAAI